MLHQQMDGVGCRTLLRIDRGNIVEHADHRAHCACFLAGAEADRRGIGGETYRPGLNLKRCAVFALGQTSATVSDADTDWVAILLGYSGPPSWAAAIYWTDGTDAYPLQVGLATADAAGRPAYALTVSIDSSQAAGVRPYPDPGLAIQPDSYPISTTINAVQEAPSVGAMPPAVYGIPGVGAKGLYEDQGIGGPATPAYLAQFGEGFGSNARGTIEVAVGQIAATIARVHNVSAGYARTV